VGDDWATAGADRAQAFVETIAGEEHPPGMRTSCLPFQMRETEHANPNLSYLAICSWI
jgi:hypothetical protein